MGNESSIMNSLTTTDAPALEATGLAPTREMGGAVNQSVPRKRANPMAMIQRLMPPTREVDDHSGTSRGMAMKLGVTWIM